MIDQGICGRGGVCGKGRFGGTGHLREGGFVIVLGPKASVGGV